MVQDDLQALAGSDTTAADLTTLTPQIPSLLAKPAFLSNSPKSKVWACD